MSTPIRSDLVVMALRNLIREIPPNTVTPEWLESALKTLQRDLTEFSIIASSAELDRSEAEDILSVIEPDALESGEQEEDGGAEARRVSLGGLPEIHPDRYESKSVLGTGGQGVVREVEDRFLGRRIALKALRKEFSVTARSARNFLREARLTAGLSHAGIVPVYDVGCLPDGSPYYTMRRIGGRSLRDILYELREARRGGRRSDIVRVEREFSRRRLLEVFVSAAHTVGYAHDRGVVHRDLKPGNLMVGDYGEVLVLDWGIALRLGSDEGAEADESLSGTSLITQRGTVKGTPGYMSPEQAFGDRAAQGPHSDVYALGLILHEILTGEPVRRPGSAEAALEMARNARIESPENRRRREHLDVAVIPEELDRIVMKCLQREPSERYRNAEELAGAVQRYLDGEQRRESAERRVMQARHRVGQLIGIEEEIARAREEARLLRDAVPTWADISLKRSLWQREDAVRAAEAKRDKTVAEALALYTQALGDDPENPRARAGLAQLYFEQLREAESWGRFRDALRFEQHVRRLDDGRLREALQGDGVLRLESDPPDAEVWLYDYAEVDRRLEPVKPRLLGSTPLETPIPMGRYLVVVRKTSGDTTLEVDCPILIRRQGRHEGFIRFVSDLPEGFVMIPAGRFIRGGDRRAPGSGPREEVWVDDFAIARYPVTCGEYLEFLRSIQRRSEAEAERHAPRSTQGGSPALHWPKDADGLFRIPRVDAHGGSWAPMFPIRCISRDDAEAYAAWRADRDKRPFRLPTESEWEKAGRGVDGRWFPWGNDFDASFCKMKDSRQGPPQPEAIGAFVYDSSPYGVRDMAGGVIEWVAGPFDRHGVLGIQKGGFWMASEASCRLARRFGAFPGEPEPFGGFRLACSL